MTRKRISEKVRFYVKWTIVSHPNVDFSDTHVDFTASNPDLADSDVDLADHNVDFADSDVVFTYPITLLAHPHGSDRRTSGRTGTWARTWTETQLADASPTRVCPTPDSPHEKSAVRRL